MKIEDITKMAQAWNQVQEASYGKKKEVEELTAKQKKLPPALQAAIKKKEGEETKEAMDPVDKSELKGKHKDRKDKDIDNDGDVDSTDKYLHKRRKAVSKAIGKDKEVEVQTQESVEEAAQPKWKVAVGNMHYTVTARNTAEASKKAQVLAKKAGNNGVGGKIEKVSEAKDHGNMNNGSPMGNGLSPSAKKELDRKTPMNPATDEPTVDKKTFDAIRASGKKAPMRNGDNAAGDKTMPNTGK